MQCAALHESLLGRFCCKSPFALVIKISFGCTRDFRVKIWGTSSPEDKLAGDLGNVIEATSTGGRWSDFFTAEKLAAGNLGLLQQYLPIADSCTAAIDDVWAIETEASTVLRLSIQIQSLRKREKAGRSASPGASREPPRLILSRGGRRSHGRFVTPWPHRLRIAAEKSKKAVSPISHSSA